MKLRRLKYNIISWPKDGGGAINEGVYSNDLDILEAQADRWAEERDRPHMVIDRKGNIVYHARAPYHGSPYVNPGPPLDLG